jgi:hypothetical protein
MTKWYAISGSWRTVDLEVRKDVETDVGHIIKASDGIVTGGALGVDFIATEAALSHDPAARQIRIILPTSLDISVRHLFNRAAENVIRPEQAEDIQSLLTKVKNANPKALIEMSFDRCDQEAYYARNTAVIETADALLAHQVNNSQGVQDAIDKAMARDIPVTRRNYFILPK